MEIPTLFAQKLSYRSCTIAHDHRLVHFLPRQRYTDPYRPCYNFRREKQSSFSYKAANTMYPMAQCLARLSSPLLVTNVQKFVKNSSTALRIAFCCVV